MRCESDMRGVRLDNTSFDLVAAETHLGQEEKKRQGRETSG